MTIFNTTDLDKSICFLNRQGTDATYITFTNEATNVSTTFDVSTVTNSTYYDVFNFTVTSGYFVENNFYYFKIFDAADNILFQDKLFVTNQTISNNLIYHINKDKYTSNVTTNEYTIYE